MKFLDEKSNFGAYLKKREKAFRSLNEDRTSRVYIVWGLKKQSLSKCHQTNITCYGHTMWDNEFEMNKPESQMALVVGREGECMATYSYLVTVFWRNLY